jgi:multimeric flavodoxin WrbA
MVLGISASGRSGRVTETAVRTILESCGEETRFISLAGLNIGGCRGCVLCAGDNRCKHKDDWLEVGEAMLDADAIVFGAPAYYGMINALGHAALERTYCFRHRERFLLAGKLGVAVGVDRSTDERPVGEYIKKMMESNKMAFVGSVLATGYSQCYDCGYGLDCAVGNIVRNHGFLDKLESSHYPLRFEEQERTVHEAEKTGKILGSMVQARREKSV